MLHSQPEDWPFFCIPSDMCSESLSSAADVVFMLDCSRLLSIVRVNCAQWWTTGGKLPLVTGHGINHSRFIKFRDLTKYVKTPTFPYIEDGGVPYPFHQHAADER